METMLVNGREKVLLCPNCRKQLGMGTHRILWCPSCKWSETGQIPESVLCCTECERTLLATEGGGSYCGVCNLHPSMQDTFLWKLCPQCGEIRKNNKCPNGHP
jgi:hypothetical protein